MSDSESSAVPPRYLLAVVLAVGIVTPGLLHFVVNAAGYGLVADVVWVGGYIGAVLVVWWGWLRPLDIAGPSG